MKLPEGYDARSGTPSDIDAIVDLLDRWDLVTFGEVDPSNRAGILYEWSATWVDVGRDVVVVQTADGSLVAYAQHSSPVPSERFRLDGFVHPDHEGRGIGSAILGWGEERTRAHVVPGGTLRLWPSTGAPNVRGLRLFEQQGYHHIRSFFQMRIDLDPSIDAGRAPDGVVIPRHVVGTDDRPVHAALDEAFEHHFGYFPEPFEEWWTRGEVDETFDASRGFVAEVDGEIVGASINGIVEGVGWVYELGVRPGWRRRGIARALLRHTFAMFAETGIHAACLGVDTENETGALEMYRSAGMTPGREWRVFEKLITGDKLRARPEEGVRR